MAAAATQARTARRLARSQSGPACWHCLPTAGMPRKESSSVAVAAPSWHPITKLHRLAQAGSSRNGGAVPPRCSAPQRRRAASAPAPERGAARPARAERAVHHTVVAARARHGRKSRASACASACRGRGALGGLVGECSARFVDARVQRAAPQRARPCVLRAGAGHVRQKRATGAWCAGALQAEAALHDPRAVIEEATETSA